jgi:hypothetical protein
MGWCLHSVLWKVADSSERKIWRSHSRIFYTRGKLTIQGIIQIGSRYQPKAGLSASLMTINYEILSNVNRLLRKSPLQSNFCTDVPISTVSKAMMKVKSDRAFTEEQQRWLELIRRHLTQNLLMEKEDIDSMPIFFQEGASWGKLNKVFEGDLETLIHEINAAIAA